MRILLHILALSTVLSVFLNKIQAQILIAENMRDKLDSTELLKGTWSIGFNANRQKSTIFDLNSAFDISMKWKRNQILGAGKFEMLLNGETRLLYGGFGHLRYRYNNEMRISPETFFQYQWDPVRGMLSRYLAGQNLRIVLLKDSLGKINLGLGMMYERELWNHNGVPAENVTPNPEDELRSLIKTNIYISGFRKLSKSTSLMVVAYYQARPDRFFFQPRIAGDINFRVKLTKKVGLAMNFNWMYDAAPVVPIYKFYYTATNSLTFSF